MSRAGWIVTVRSPDATSRTWRFGPGEVRVGRDASCGVRLEAAEISGVHLRLLLGDHAASVVDAESRHGARLDGEPLPPGRAVPLPAGAEVALAGHHLRVDPDAPGGFTTDSRLTADRAAEVRAAVAGVAGRAPDEAAPVVKDAPHTTRGTDRIYVLALVLATLGAMLALAALGRALTH